MGTDASDPALGVIVTPVQCREGRTLIRLSQAEFARVAGVPRGALSDFEFSSLKPKPFHLAAIRAALEVAGVEFTNGEGPGVRMRKGGATMPSKQEEPKVCPLCDHVFQGNGWDGIDAHWKARHLDVMPYREASELIKSGDYESIRKAAANRK
jgi:hypothetical protein